MLIFDFTFTYINLNCGFNFIKEGNMPHRVREGSMPHKVREGGHALGKLVGSG